MKKSIHDMLERIAREAGMNGPAAVYAVVQLLHDCYECGTVNEFAAHCCRFSAGLSVGDPRIHALQPETRYTVN